MGIILVITTGVQRKPHVIKPTWQTRLWASSKQEWTSVHKHTPTASIQTHPDTQKFPLTSKTQTPTNEKIKCWNIKDGEMHRL